MSNITVIEIDQWSSTGDIDKWTFQGLKTVIEESDDGEVPKIEGGDAEAAQRIFGGRYEVKTVDESDEPGKGCIWFIEGDDGELEEYKRNVTTK